MDDVIQVSRKIGGSVGREKIKALSKISYAAGFYHFAIAWVLIIGAIVLSETLRHPLVYVLAVFFIAGRFHALVGIAHDGAHFMMLPSKRWNDVMTVIFATWPLFTSLRKYRRAHLPHHNFLNTTQDPDYVMFSVDEEFDFPKDRNDLLWVALRDLTGITAVRKLVQSMHHHYYLLRFGGQGIHANHNRLLLLQWAFYLVTMTTVSIVFGWHIVVLYWIVPFATWFQFIFRWRTIAEHYALPQEVFVGTRNVLPNILERVFLVPNNLNYHLDHHLFPSVPMRNLPALHRLLMTDEYYSASAANLSTYFLVIRDCLRKGTQLKAAT